MVKFSIVTVVKNGLSKISTTVESVLSQTYDNYEHVIIDGDSVDGTLDVVSGYNSRKIFLYSEPDNGLYDAMNKGIKLSTGDYILFLNAGDKLSTSNVLQDISSAIHSNMKNENFRPSIVYGDSIEFISTREMYYKKSRNCKWRNYGMFTHHQAIFYNLFLVKAANIVYQTNYKIAADWEFTLRVLKYEYCPIRVDFPVCNFEDGGISTIAFRIGLEEQYLIRRKVLKMSIINSLAIKILQLSIIKIRRKFPLIYAKVKFRKVY